MSIAYALALHEDYMKTCLLMAAARDCSRAVVHETHARRASTRRSSSPPARNSIPSRWSN